MRVEKNGKVVGEVKYLIKDRKDFVELLKVEWVDHKNNFDEEDCWFECGIAEAATYTNYAVGASINLYDATNGKTKTVVLKTKKQADAYSLKEFKQSAFCVVCQRFKRMISALKQVKKQSGAKK